MTKYQTIYFVGNKSSEKRNSWLAMTADKEAANKLLSTIKGATCVVEKKVDVTPRRIVH